ncbi:MAG: hypothetical protein COB98_02825 [Flavobacteriaceae bacterium]|nr:MAG: hypothetical protein COB98_02825 [Flavobacteriaceae bacterium]
MAVKRLMALDVLRGLTIALMILVNTPGSWSYVYPPLLHAKWHGCTPTDLVFPFFLFIVGVSMWYAFSKFDKGITKSALLKVLKRFSIMFLLGLFLNAFPKFEFENLRVMGVLQRIAVAYLLGALLCLQFSFKQLLAVFGALLVGYWGLLQLNDATDLYGLSDNLVRQIDVYLLGENHIYKGFGIPFDPEGLLSCLPAVATVLLGYFSGRLITGSLDVMRAVKSLVIYGALAVALGTVWSYWFPINKSLWTSTYVLYTGGLAMLFLAFLLFLIDVKGVKKWATPFLHFGTNPLFIFVFSGLFAKTLIYLVSISNASGEIESGYAYLYHHVFVPVAGHMNGSLLFAISHIVVYWFITYVMYKRKIFIKI